jgi:hypothetical protein
LPSVPEQPFPFVIGSGRSGTTLLRVMLDAHEEMAIPHESYFIEQLARRRDRFRAPDGRFARAAFEQEIFSDARFIHWGLEPSLVRAELDAADELDLAEAIRCTYRAYASSQGAARYGDKTPSYSLAVQRLAALLPEAVFIHLIRDARDVVRSYVRTSFGPRTLRGAAARWRLYVRRARAQGLVLPRERYLEVRYEALVDDPSGELLRICELIGLEFQPAMLDYTRGAAATDAARHEAGVHTAVTRPPTADLRDWRRELEPRQIAAIEDVAGDTLAELGYPLTVSRRRTSVAARAARAAVAVGGGVRRTRAVNRARPAARRVLRREH